MPQSLARYLSYYPSAYLTIKRWRLTFRWDVMCKSSTSPNQLGLLSGILVELVTPAEGGRHHTIVTYSRWHFRPVDSRPIHSSAPKRNVPENTEIKEQRSSNGLFHSSRAGFYQAHNYALGINANRIPYLHHCFKFSTRFLLAATAGKTES